MVHVYGAKNLVVVVAFLRLPTTVVRLLTV